MLTLGLSPDQKRMRVGKIGASNAPGIRGLSKWSSPFQEWVKILHPFEDQRTPAQTMGLLVEWPLMQHMAEQAGIKISRGWSVQHPDHDWMLATADAIEGVNVPWECKFVSTPGAPSWKDEDGVVRAPIYVRVQSLHQQIVLGSDRGVIVACIVDFDGVTFHMEEVRSTQAERDQHMRELSEFYHNHIVTGIQPPVDASGRTAEVLTKRHPSPTGAVLEPTEDDCALAITRAQLTERKREIESQIDLVDNKMRARIGDALGINGIATWRERKGAISYAKAARDAGLSDEYLNGYRGMPTRILKWEE